MNPRNILLLVVALLGIAAAVYFVPFSRVKVTVLDSERRTPVDGVAVTFWQMWPETGKIIPCPSDAVSILPCREPSKKIRQEKFTNIDGAVTYWYNRPRAIAEKVTLSFDTDSPGYNSGGGEFGPTELGNSITFELDPY